MSDTEVKLENTATVDSVHLAAARTTDDVQSTATEPAETEPATQTRDEKVKALKNKQKAALAAITRLNNDIKKYLGTDKNINEVKTLSSRLNVKVDTYD